MGDDYNGAFLYTLGKKINSNRKINKFLLISEDQSQALRKELPFCYHHSYFHQAHACIMVSIFLIICVLKIFSFFILKDL